MEKIKNLPRLMNDESELDGSAETVMDYVISWTLRRADVICANDKPKLYDYCRVILANILSIDLNDSIIFENIKVWKQDQRIDLWVELVVSMDNQKEQHAILIENKYYSQLHNTKDTDGEYRNQLIVYKNKFDEHYRKQTNQWYKHYALITCINKDDPNFKKAKYDSAEGYGYNVFTYEELKSKVEECESDIFNEFWINW